MDSRPLVQGARSPKLSERACYEDRGTRGGGQINACIVGIDTQAALGVPRVSTLEAALGVPRATALI